MLFINFLCLYCLIVLATCHAISKSISQENIDDEPGNLKEYDYLSDYAPRYERHNKPRKERRIHKVTKQTHRDPIPTSEATSNPTMSSTVKQSDQCAMHSFTSLFRNLKHKKKLKKEEQSKLDLIDSKSLYSITQLDSPNIDATSEKPPLNKKRKSRKSRFTNKRKRDLLTSTTKDYILNFNGPTSYNFGTVTTHLQVEQTGTPPSTSKPMQLSQTDAKNLVNADGKTICVLSDLNKPTTEHLLAAGVTLMASNVPLPSTEDGDNTGRIEDLLNSIKAKVVEILADHSSNLHAANMVSNSVTVTTYKMEPSLFVGLTALPFTTEPITYKKIDFNVTSVSGDNHAIQVRCCKDFKAIKGICNKVIHRVSEDLKNEIKQTVKAIKSVTHYCCQSTKKNCHEGEKQTTKKKDYSKSEMECGLVTSSKSLAATKTTTATPTTVTMKTTRQTEKTTKRENKKVRQVNETIARIWKHVRRNKYRTTHNTTPRPDDDYVLLSLYEQMLTKSEQINHLGQTAPVKRSYNNEKALLSKRNTETLTDLSLKENIQNIFNDGEVMPEVAESRNNVDDSDEISNPDSTDALNEERQQTEAATEDITIEGLSDKLAYKDYINGYKYYLKFQKELKNENFSDLVKYQAHRHHNVDDIGKYILEKLPQVPKLNRSKRRFFDDDTMDDQDVSTRSEDSWFKKHFYFFIDNGPPKKYHTSQTVSLKSHDKSTTNAYEENFRSENEYVNVRKKRRHGRSLDVTSNPELGTQNVKHLLTAVNRKTRQKRIRNLLAKVALQKANGPLYLIREDGNETVNRIKRNNYVSTQLNTDKYEDDHDPCENSTLDNCGSINKESCGNQNKHSENKTEKPHECNNDDSITLSNCKKVETLRIPKSYKRKGMYNNINENEKPKAKRSYQNRSQRFAFKHLKNIFLGEQSEEPVKTETKYSYNLDKLSMYKIPNVESLYNQIPNLTDSDAVASNTDKQKQLPFTKLRSLQKYGGVWNAKYSKSDPNPRKTINSMDTLYKKPRPKQFYPMSRFVTSKSKDGHKSHDYYIEDAGLNFKEMENPLPKLLFHFQSKHARTKAAKTTHSEQALLHDLLVYNTISPLPDDYTPKYETYEKYYRTTDTKSTEKEMRYNERYGKERDRYLSSDLKSTFLKERDDVNIRYEDYAVMPAPSVLETDPLLRMFEIPTNHEPLKDSTKVLYEVSRTLNDADDENDIIIQPTPKELFKQPPYSKKQHNTNKKTYTTLKTRYKTPSTQKNIKTLYKDSNRLKEKTNDDKITYKKDRLKDNELFKDKEKFKELNKEYREIYDDIATPPPPEDNMQQYPNPREQPVDLPMDFEDFYIMNSDILQAEEKQPSLQTLYDQVTKQKYIPTTPDATKMLKEVDDMTDSINMDFGLTTEHIRKFENENRRHQIKSYAKQLKQTTAKHKKLHHYVTPSVQIIRENSKLSHKRMVAKNAIDGPMENMKAAKEFIKQMKTKDGDTTNIYESDATKNNFQSSETTNRMLIDTTLLAYDDGADVFTNQDLGVDKLSKPDSKKNTPPKQFFSTPVPMKFNEFENFLKENDLDLFSLTSPLENVPRLHSFDLKHRLYANPTKIIKMDRQYSKDSQRADLDTNASKTKRIKQFFHITSPANNTSNITGMTTEMTKVTLFRDPNYIQEKKPEKRMKMELYSKPKTNFDETDIINVEDDVFSVSRPITNQNSTTYKTGKYFNNTDVIQNPLEEITERSPNRDRTKIMKTPLKNKHIRYKTYKKTNPRVIYPLPLAEHRIITRDHPDTKTHNSLLYNQAATFPYTLGTIMTKNLDISEPSQPDHEFTTFYSHHGPAVKFGKGKKPHPKQVLFSDHVCKFDVSNLPKRHINSDYDDEDMERLSNSVTKTNIFAKKVDHTKPNVIIHIDLPTYYQPNTEPYQTDLVVQKKLSWHDHIVRCISGLALVELLNKYGFFKTIEAFHDKNVNTSKVFSENHAKGYMEVTTAYSTVSERRGRYLHNDLFKRLQEATTSLELGYVASRSLPTTDVPYNYEDIENILIEDESNRHDGGEKFKKDSSDDRCDKEMSKCRKELAKCSEEKGGKDGGKGNKQKGKGKDKGKKEGDKGKKDKGKKDKSNKEKGKKDKDNKKKEEGKKDKGNKGKEKGKKEDTSKKGKGKKEKDKKEKCDDDDNDKDKKQKSNKEYDEYNREEEEDQKEKSDKEDDKCNKDDEDDEENEKSDKDDDKRNKEEDEEQNEKEKSNQGDDECEEDDRKEKSNKEDEECNKEDDDDNNEKEKYSKEDDECNKEDDDGHKDNERCNKEDDDCNNDDDDGNKGKDKCDQEEEKCNQQDNENCESDKKHSDFGDDYGDYNKGMGGHDDDHKNKDGHLNDLSMFLIPTAKEVALKTESPKTESPKTESPRTNSPITDSPKDNDDIDEEIGDSDDDDINDIRVPTAHTKDQEPQEDFNVNFEKIIIEKGFKVFSKKRKNPPENPEENLPPPPKTNMEDNKNSQKGPPHYIQNDRDPMVLDQDTLHKPARNETVEHLKELHKELEQILSLHQEVLSKIKYLKNRFQVGLSGRKMKVNRRQKREKITQENVRKDASLQSFTAKDVSALEVIVDLVKNPQLELDDSKYIGKTSDISSNDVGIAMRNNPERIADNSSIELHICIPSNFGEKKKRSNTMRVRKVFSAILSTPVDIEYQIRSFVDDPVAVTKAMPVIESNKWQTDENTKISSIPNDKEGNIDNNKDVWKIEPKLTTTKSALITAETTTTLPSLISTTDTSSELSMTDTIVSTVKAYTFTTPTKVYTLAITGATFTPSLRSIDDPYAKKTTTNWWRHVTTRHSDQKSTEFQLSKSKILQAKKSIVKTLSTRNTNDGSSGQNSMLSSSIMIPTLMHVSISNPCITNKALEQQSAATSESTLNIMVTLSTPQVIESAISSSLDKSSEPQLNLKSTPKHEIINYARRSSDKHTINFPTDTKMFELSKVRKVTNYSTEPSEEEYNDVKETLQTAEAVSKTVISKPPTPFYSVHKVDFDSTMYINNLLTIQNKHDDKTKTKTTDYTSTKTNKFMPLSLLADVISPNITTNKPVSSGRVTLSKEFIAAVDDRVIQLFLNLTQLQNKGLLNQYKVKRDTEKLSYMNKLDWDVIKQTFKRDTNCQCKCKENKVLCRSCAASEAVLSYIILEFDNLAKLFSEHCTEVQSYLCKDPRGRRRLRDILDRINNSINAYDAKQNGKCQPTCSNVTIGNAKVHADDNQFTRNCTNHFDFQQLFSASNNLNKAINLDVCPTKNLTQSAKTFYENAKSCLLAKNTKMNDDYNVKNVYSLDRINVNIICKQNEHSYDKISTEIALDNKDLELSSNNVPDVVNIPQPTTKKVKGIKKMFFFKSGTKRKPTKLSIPRNDQVARDIWIPEMKTKKKRDADNNNQLEPPIITDSGGSFWHEYLNHDNRNGRSSPRKYISQHSPKIKKHLFQSLKDLYSTPKTTSPTEIMGFMTSINSVPSVLSETSQTFYNVNIFGTVNPEQDKSSTPEGCICVTKNKNKAKSKTKQDVKSTTQRSLFDVKKETTTSTRKPKTTHAIPTTTTLSASKAETTKKKEKCRRKSTTRLAKTTVAKTTQHTSSFFSSTPLIHKSTPPTSTTITTTSTYPRSMKMWNKIISTLDFYHKYSKAKLANDNDNEFIDTTEAFYSVNHDENKRSIETGTSEEGSNLLLSICLYKKRKADDDWISLVATETPPSFNATDLVRQSAKTVFENLAQTEITTANPKCSLASFYPELRALMDRIKSLKKKVAPKLKVTNLPLMKRSEKKYPKHGTEEPDLDPGSRKICDLPATYGHIINMYTQLPQSNFEKYIKTIKCFKYRTSPTVFKVKRQMTLKTPRKLFTKPKRTVKWNWIRRKRFIRIGQVQKRDRKINARGRKDFEEFVRDDAGVYKVKYDGRRKRQADEAEDEMTSMDNEIFAHIGDSIVIKCEPDATSSRSSIRKAIWEYNPQLFKVDNIDINDNVITLMSVQPHNDGEYYCKTQAMHKRVKLTVITIPAINIVYIPVYSSTSDCDSISKSFGFVDSLSREMSQYLCPSSSQCSLGLHEPFCVRDPRYNKAHIQSTAVVTINPPPLTCNVECRKGLLSALSSLSANNFNTIFNTPVILTADDYNQTLYPATKKEVYGFWRHSLVPYHANNNKAERFGNYQLAKRANEFVMKSISNMSPGHIRVLAACPAGQYLMKRSSVCAVCPANSWSLPGQNYCVSPRNTRTMSARSQYSYRHRWFGWRGWSLAWLCALCACAAAACGSVLRVRRRRAPAAAPPSAPVAPVAPPTHVQQYSSTSTRRRPLSPSRVILTRLFSSPRRYHGNQEDKFNRWKLQNSRPPVPPVDFDW